MRSDRLGETLLPKRIALPVFASDALSSAAYAPDEIFLTLAFAGCTFATTHSWQIGLAVVFVMLVVVASYRQNVKSHLFFTPGVVVVTSVPWQMRSSQGAEGRFASVPVRYEGLEEPLGGAEEALEVAIAGPEGDRQ
jgi:hypothetical protein